MVRLISTNSPVPNDENTPIHKRTSMFHCHFCALFVKFFSNPTSDVPVYV